MRVLVATDGSPDAKAAVKWLLRFPLPRATEVLVLAVAPVPHSPLDPEAMREMREAIREGRSSGSRTRGGQTSWSSAPAASAASSGTFSGASRSCWRSTHGARYSSQGVRRARSGACSWRRTAPATRSTRRVPPPRSALFARFAFACSASSSPCACRPRPRIDRRRYARPAVPCWLPGGPGASGRIHALAVDNSLSVAAVLVVAGVLALERSR